MSQELSLVRPLHCMYRETQIMRWSGSTLLEAQINVLTADNCCDCREPASAAIDSSSPGVERCWGATSTPDYRFFRERGFDGIRKFGLRLKVFGEAVAQVRQENVRVIRASSTVEAASYVFGSRRRHCHQHCIFMPVPSLSPASHGACLR